MRRRLAAAVLLPTLLAGCGVLFAPARSEDERLSAFPRTGLPLDQPVTIRWNSYAVPYVQAATDHDAAFTLGLVHAHLREGQLALGKRIAYGRLSESAGPFTNDIDQTLRLIDFPNAAPATIERLPPATRAWLDAFVDGLNWYQDHAPARPPEYGLLGLRRERWTVADVLALGRLAGTDINWLTYFGLSGARDRPDWSTVWDRMLHSGYRGMTSFPRADQQAALGAMLLAYGRTGSNSVVIAPQRSATGAALLASDPHLALLLPNLWVLAGLSTPHLSVVGLMPAGLPVFGLGRTQALAWGGTNMRAASSDLIDASAEKLTETQATIRTRVWSDKHIMLRRSPDGPIISDSPLFTKRPGEVVALRWVGHQPSDEVTAFLAAARATTPEEFRAAFATYAVGAQNMQFADAAGNIGQVMATWLPRRPVGATPSSLVLKPDEPAAQWDGFLTVTELPWSLNPPSGFLASANNPPTTLDRPIGYFFINSERVERLKTVLAANDHVSVADLVRLQMDVTSPASRRLAAQLLVAIDAAGVSDAAPDLIAGLRGWDGDYEASARAPVLFETLLYHVAHRLYGTGPDQETVPRPYADWNWLVMWLPRDLAARSAVEQASLLRQSLAAADRDAAAYPNWGAMHVMRVQPAWGLLPVIGKWFRLEEYPVSGSRETPMKTAHGLVHERHAASYGSQSRFVADMSGPDNAWFTLFGGQDGWVGSANVADQIPLWKTGGSIRMPLTPEAVAQEFPIVMTLSPAAAR